YAAADAARIARWQTAISRGGLWLAGYWRVPWQLNGVRVGLIDPAKRVIGLVPNPSNAASALVSNGIGDKYARPAGSKTEPWFALNLLEEIDVPGEWSVDFSRQRLHLLLDRDGPPADGEIEFSDVGSVLFQLNGASDVVLRGLTFRRHLGINVQITNNASRNLVLGCRFVQSGNMAVDIRDGVSNGVLSSDFEQLASGGVMLRGGSLLPDGTPVPTDHFAVNNKFRSFGEVVRVYQAAIDVGFGGPMGSWGLPTVGMRVAQNDVRSSPHAGILWNGHRHVIEYNEVSDFTRLSNDLGAIYRFGRNADLRTVIRYNHLFDSPLGEGVYNDQDHVRTPVYGNTVNLKTPASASRGYGFWSNTHTTAGEANTALPMGLQVFNNVFVNTRSGASFHSATGGRIENNVSYRPLADHFRWVRITTNTTTNTHAVATSNAATLQSGPNPAYASDPGFIDYADDDLRLRPDAAVYRDLPGFVPVPLELAGLRPDETRADDPSVRVWTPFIVTGAAYSVGTTAAVFSGTLVYPQFDANAVVRIHYGTTDGGADPAAWQHVAVLGRPGSGHLAHPATGLAPGTRYYFRFHAENAAGAHWAERSNFTTTFLSAVTPDTTGPVLLTPGDLDVEAAGTSGATVSFEVSAEDALSGYAAAVATPPSGSLFPLGPTIVSVTAADAAGNVSTTSFTVTVRPRSLPAPFTLQQIKPYSGVAPGSVEVLSPTSFRIVGRGGASTGGATADLWTGTNDSHTYVSLPWQGDGVFTAR
ncbi:MAG: HYR domain-containing protein, partial [Burkholderiales bacterium]|nr:HYR domain-containing protein [Opitutaceae bacterium]